MRVESSPSVLQLLAFLFESPTMESVPGGSSLKLVNSWRSKELALVSMLCAFSK